MFLNPKVSKTKTISNSIYFTKQAVFIEDKNVKETIYCNSKLFTTIENGKSHIVVRVSTCAW